MLQLANSNALQNSTLDYNNYGGWLSFGSLTSTTFGGLQGTQGLSLTSTSGNVALTVGGNNASTFYNGQLSGGGSLIKTGVGTLTLGTPNTFTGLTQITSGVLQLAHSNALLNSTLDYNNYGGLLSFGSLTSVTFGSLKAHRTYP